jgi:HTH-type transcriptional regulator/antitoxin HigA
MVIRPIRNDADHAAALRRIEELWEAREGSEESDELEVLSTLVSVYEDARWPIDAPDAVDVLRYVMDQRNLSASDLVPYIGQRGHVYDVLNPRRRLSLTMIQRLSEPLIDRRSPGRAIRRHAVPALSVPRRKGAREPALRRAEPRRW